MLFSGINAQTAFADDFTFTPLASWTQWSADGITWDFNSNAGANMAGAMHAYDVGSGQTQAWLQTPVMDLTAMTMPTIEFATAGCRNNFMDPRMGLWFDDGGGSGWQLLETWGSVWDAQADNQTMPQTITGDPSTWVPTAAEWVAGSHILSPFINWANIRFSFGFEGVNGGAIWLDDVIIYDASTVGVKEQATQEIAIYPNPSNGVITVAMDNFSAPEVLKAFDITGKEVSSASLTASSTTVDLSDLPAGVYTLRIGNNGVGTCKRLIIQ